MYKLLNVIVEFRNNEIDGNNALFLLVFNSKLPVVRLKFPKRICPREWWVGGDFSWTLNPDIAAMMIVAMVVGLGADNKVLRGTHLVAKDRGLPILFLRV